MSSLTKKATGGLIWSILNNIGVYGISFIVGIILARLLSPEEFGLIGMITVFITLLSVFVDSGFKTALIRKTDCNQTDYSTVFFFNVAISIFLYLILFFSSEYISFFYNEPELNSLLKVLGIVIVIEAFSLIQTTILTKQLNFKLQALISIIAGALSGIIGILLAYMGFGVWSLVFYSLINKLLLSAFYWLFNKWRPSFVFSFISFREFFAFGSKLMLANFINTLQKNLSYLVIGKYYSATDLGHYTRAGQFYNLPTHVVMSTIGRVTLPILAELNNDNKTLKNACERILKTVMFVSVPTILLMAAVAEPMVILLVGEKWKPSVIFLQLMCLSGVWFPMHSINLNILQIKGKSGLYLKLEIVKKIINFLLIGTAIIWDIKTMLIIGVFNSMLLTYLNSYFNKKLINYSYLQQMKSISKIIFFSLIMASTTVLIYELVLKSEAVFISLPLLVIVGFVIYTIFSYFFMKPQLKEFGVIIKELFD